MIHQRDEGIENLGGQRYNRPVPQQNPRTPVYAVRSEDVKLVCFLLIA